MTDGDSVITVTNRDESRPSVDGVAAGEGGRYLTFMLGGETYALDILDITEIIEFRALTVVPMMPAFIRGVINLRGRVLPVIDLAARFGQGETEVGRRTGVIIVDGASEGADASGSGDGGVGIMVDAVNKVVYIAEDDIEPPPAFGAGIQSEFIRGMARYQGDFIIVLDVVRLISVESLAAFAPAQAFAPTG